MQRSAKLKLTLLPLLASASLARAQSGPASVIESSAVWAVRGIRHCQLEECQRELEDMRQQSAREAPEQGDYLFVPRNGFGAYFQLSMGG